MVLAWRVMQSRLRLGTGAQLMLGTVMHSFYSLAATKLAPVSPLMLSRLQFGSSVQPMPGMSMLSSALLNATLTALA
jgi:hypothetical protein